MLLRNVSVALSCRDRSMPKKLLYHSDVNPIAKKECSNGVSQHVRGYVPLYASIFAQPSNHV